MMTQEAPPPSGGRKRDQRRKLAIAVRLKVGSRWGDATVLNASERGLMVRASEPPEYGSYVEVRRGAGVGIVARVIWRRGNEVGLRTQDEVNVQALMRPPLKGRNRGRAASNMGASADVGPSEPIGVRLEGNRQKGSLLQYSALGGGVVVAACLAGAYVYDTLSAVTRTIAASM